MFPVVDISILRELCSSPTGHAKLESVGLGPLAAMLYYVKGARVQNKAKQRQKE